MINKVVKLNNSIGILNDETQTGYNFYYVNLDNLIEQPYSNKLYSKYSEELNFALNDEGIKKDCETYLNDLDNFGFFDEKIESSYYGEELDKMTLFYLMVKKAIEESVFLTDLDSFNFEEEFDSLIDSKKHWKNK